MSMVLQPTAGGDARPHPQGIFAGVCVDVIDLGLMETEFRGQRRLARKVRLVFETEQFNAEKRPYVISKTFTASLHPKARLTEFLGKWRGRPIGLNEGVDLDKAIGSSCTLVIGHQQSPGGRTYAAIDAVSRPSRRVVPSGLYDGALARQRIEEWKARQGMGGFRDYPNPAVRAAGASPAPSSPAAPPVSPNTEWAPPGEPYPAEPQSEAGSGSSGPEFDPEVGF